MDEPFVPRRGEEKEDITWLVEKSQCFMMISKSATLPGTGRGGWDFCCDAEDWISRYTRLGPTPFVLVTCFEIGRSLGGRRTTFRGGKAGFDIADEKPIASGTVTPNRDES